MATEIFTSIDVESAQRLLKEAEHLLRCGYIVQQSELLPPTATLPQHKQLKAALAELSISIPDDWPYRRKIWSELCRVLQDRIAQNTLIITEFAEGGFSVGDGLPLGQLCERAGSHLVLRNASLLSCFALFHLIDALANSTITLEVSAFPSNSETHSLLTGNAPHSDDASWRNAPFFVLGQMPAQPVYLYEIGKAEALLEYAFANWLGFHIVLTNTEKEARWLRSKFPQTMLGQPVLLRNDPAQPVAVVSEIAPDGMHTLHNNEAILGNNFQEHELELMNYLPVQRYTYLGTQYVLYYSTTKPSDTAIAQARSRCAGTLFIFCSKL
jgi:hypothetical protein